MSWQALVYQWKAQNTFRLDPDSIVIAQDENRIKGAKCIKKCNNETNPSESINQTLTDKLNYCKINFHNKIGY